MKKLLFSIIIISLSHNISCSNNNLSAVTYQVSTGRLGDHLIFYCKAKYISIKYNIPLYYKPFEYSDQLMLDTLETKFTDAIKKNYIKTEVVTSYKNINPNNKTLYVIDHNHWKDLFCSKNWYGLPDDKEFFRILKQYIKPRRPILSIEKNNGHISIAVHVRTGGDYDPKFYPHAMANTERFPSITAYATKIKKLLNFLPKNNIDLYILTDDNNPQKMVEALQHELYTYELQYFYRKNNNSHDKNVIEDLFLMAQCDCLIRPRSSYSVIAQIVGDIKIVLHSGWGLDDYIFQIK